MTSQSRRGRLCAIAAAVYHAPLALLTLALLGTMSLLAPPARAQLRLETNPDSALANVLASIEGTPITLADAVGGALAHATRAREAEASLRAAMGELRSERGAFDPEIFATVEKTEEEMLNTNPFSPDNVFRSEETSTDAGARIRLRTGTELSATLETTKREANDPFSLLNPQYDTAGRLEFRQPLLKGFWPAARSDLTAAERRFEEAEARYRDAVLEVWADVEATYWNLHAAERNFAVQRLIADRANVFVAEARVREAAGLVGPSQVATAQVFLAEQELAALDDAETLDGVSDRLATLVGTRPRDGAARYRPSDTPPRDFPVEPQDSLVARAFSQNFELLAAQRSVDAVRAEARGARWNAFPALDVMGSLGGNGTSGEGREVVFGSDTLRSPIDGDFGDTWDQVSQRDFPTWSIGLALSVPIGWRAAGGEHDRLVAEADAAEQRLIATRRDIDERVRASHRELVNGTRRLELARSGVAAAFEQVRIGLIEYENGRVTAFEVVRLGADVPRAQQNLSDALVRTAKAAATLRRLLSDKFPTETSEDGRSNP